MNLRPSPSFPDAKLTQPVASGAQSNALVRERCRKFPQPGRMRIAVLLLLFQLALLGTTVYLGYLFFQDRSPLHARWFVAGMFGYGVLFLLRYLHAQSLICPLCHGTVASTQTCAKHSRARRHFPFGHASSALLDALACGMFRCMYCGTGFRLKK